MRGSKSNVRYPVIISNEEWKYTAVVYAAKPNGNERNLRHYSPHMRLRPPVRCPIAKRQSQLVREE